MKTFQEFVVEAQKCWPGYKKKGTKKLFGKTYNNCVKEEFELEEPGEDKKTGEAKRAKLYGKIFGKKSTKASPKTGLMTGKVSEEFKQMPRELMNRQFDKKAREESILDRAGRSPGYGRRTKAKEDKQIKLKMQMNKMQLAMKQDYNNGKDSYDVFYKNPLKTGKIVNHRFR